MLVVLWFLFWVWRLVWWLVDVFVVLMVGLDMSCFVGWCFSPVIIALCCCCLACCRFGCWICRVCWFSWLGAWVYLSDIVWVVLLCVDSVVLLYSLLF